VSLPLEPLLVVVIAVDEDPEDSEGTGASLESPLAASRLFLSVAGFCSVCDCDAFFLRCVFQTFLISLSVLPGRHAAILDHLNQIGSLVRTPDSPGPNNLQR
jgi:hypothetical protein